MFSRLNVRTRMFILIIGINALMLAAIFITYYGTSKRTVIREIQGKAMERVENVASNLKGYLDAKARTAWTFCENPQMQQWLETNDQRTIAPGSDPQYDRLIDYINQIVSKDKEIRSIFFASEKTQMYYHNLENNFPPDYYVGKRPWYQNTVKAGHPIFDIDEDIVYKQVFVNYRRPIYNKDGNLLGVGGVDMTLDHLKRFLTELNIFATGQVMLIGSNGKFLYHPNQKWVLEQSLGDLMQDEKNYKHLDLTVERASRGEGGIDRVIYAGESCYLISASVPDLGWLLVYSVSTREINAPLLSLTRVFVVIVSLTLSLLVFAILFITGSISRPIQSIVTLLKDISEGEGDLTKRMSVERDDELGEMARMFNMFVDKLHEIISLVRINTENVADASDQITAASTQLATGAEAQNAQASEVAASMHQMTASIFESSQNATQSAEIAKTATSKAEEGSQAMRATLDGMEEIVSTTAKTSEIVDALSNRTGQIGEILEVINEIADQTNLLALNAAIEAARAGDQGRGFAVVADEVRKLAERTTKATEEISETVVAIQGDTLKASESMTAARSVVKRGKEAALKTETVLKDIITSVTHATDMIIQIAVASEQMSAGAEEISKNVESISTVTRQSVDSSEQMASTAEQLRDQMNQLRQLVHRFHLHQDMQA